jgi:predicted transcriptional regulator
MKVNMQQIQREIIKAMQDVDWKKLNEATESAMNEAQDQVKSMKEAYVIQLGNYQRERTLRLEKLKQAQQQILMDRLQQREQVRKMEEDKKQRDEEKKKACKITVRKKKIIHI